jgi:hypothetical protein
MVQWHTCRAKTSWRQSSPTLKIQACFTIEPPIALTSCDSTGSSSTLKASKIGVFAALCNDVPLSGITDTRRLCGSTGKYRSSRGIKILLAAEAMTSRRCSFSTGLSMPEMLVTCWKVPCSSSKYARCVGVSLESTAFLTDAQGPHNPVSRGGCQPLRLISGLNSLSAGRSSVSSAQMSLCRNIQRDGCNAVSPKNLHQTDVFLVFPKTKRPETHYKVAH